MLGRSGNGKQFFSGLIQIFQLRSGVYSVYKQTEFWVFSTGNYFTEITGGDWDTNFAGGLTWDNRMITIGQTKNWAKAVFFFNIALDQNHGPRVSCLECLTLFSIKINITQAYECIFSALKHICNG